MPVQTGILAYTDTVTWTQTYDNRNVGTGKTLTPAGTVNDGNGGGVGRCDGQRDRTEQHTVDPIRHVTRVERGDLFGPGGRAANVDSGHRALLAEDGAAPGERAEVGHVADPNSRNVGKSFHALDLRFLW